MKVTELDEHIATVLADSDHPEIAEIEMTATPERPDNHTRIVVRFADGATAVIMVRQVAGVGRRPHAEYELPREVL